MIQKIFNEIAAAAGTVSGDSVGRVLGISKMAVSKYVKKLISQGVHIDVSSKGYTYINSDSLDVISMSYKLRKSGLDNIEPIIEVVESTNTMAKTVAKDYAGDYVYLAPYQTQGRGRNKRQFVSELGGLYMTYSMNTPNLLITDSLNIVLLSGLAVSNVLEKYNIKSEIKWPNDVYVGGKKICGILLESNVTQSIIDRIYIGIGVNINNNLADTISEIATTMRLQGANNAKREDVAVEIIAEINRLMKGYTRDGQSSFKKDYLAKSWTIDRKVSAEIKGVEVEGIATEITELGYLKIETIGREYIVIAGDVT